MNAFLLLMFPFSCSNSES